MQSEENILHRSELWRWKRLLCEMCQSQFVTYANSIENVCSLDLVNLSIQSNWYRTHTFTLSRPPWWQLCRLFAVRNLLIMSSVFSLIGGVVLFIVSALLLDGLRREEESAFKAWLYTMGIFAPWKILAWAFAGILTPTNLECLCCKIFLVVTYGSRYKNRRGTRTRVVGVEGEYADHHPHHHGPLFYSSDISSSFTGLILIPLELN